MPVTNSDIKPNSDNNKLRYASSTNKATWQLLSKHSCKKSAVPSGQNKISIT